MPRRPPKRWWESCVRGVEESGGADDPKAVCGDEWYHEKTQAERDAIVRKEERRKRKKHRK